MEKSTLQFTESEIKALKRYIPETTTIGRAFVLFMKREPNWDGKTFWDSDWKSFDYGKRVPIGAWKDAVKLYLRGTTNPDIISARKKINKAIREWNKIWEQK